MKNIYADNAATTKLDPDAFQAMKPFLLDNYGNASQPYLFSKSARDALKKARQVVADCINADPDEIYFTSGGSESDNWALKGSALENPQLEFITSAIEHHAILHTCDCLKRLGHKVVLLSVDKYGRVDTEELKAQLSLSKGPTLVSVMLANNEIGTVEPISEICQIAHLRNAIVHTDAVQAVGHIPIDVKKLDVDMLSASGHKFNGPKGVGFLYIRRGIDLKPYIDGGAQEGGLRAGTENVASIVGMAVALNNNIKNLDHNEKKIRKLKEEFFAHLDGTKIDYIRNGDSENSLPGTINISIKNASGEVLLNRLDLMGIYISTGSACNSKETEVSHVIKAIDVPADYADGTIRISLGVENTSEDVADIVAALKKIVKC